MARPFDRYEIEFFWSLKLELYWFLRVGECELVNSTLVNIGFGGVNIAACRSISEASIKVTGLLLRPRICDAPEGLFPHIDLCRPAVP